MARHTALATRGTTGLLGVVVAGALLTGCAGLSGPPDEATTPPGQPTGTAGVTMRATLSTGMPRAPGAAATGTPGLVVDYTVRNTGDGPVVVHDRVPDALGSAVLPTRLDPEHAWVFAVEGVLRVSKQGFAPAPGTRFVAAPRTGAHVLPPGATLQGRAFAPLPPRLDVPGAEFTAPRGPIAGLTSWQFCVQVARGVPVPGATTAAGSGLADPPVVPVAVTAPGPDELLCSPVAPLPP